TGGSVSATIGGVTLSYTNPAQFNFLSFKGTVSLNLNNFVTLTGGFGFEQTGSGPTAEIHIAAQSVIATMSAGTFSVGLNGGSLALLLKSDGTKALDAFGSLSLNGGGFVIAAPTSVRVQFNNTGTPFSSTPQNITVGDING